MNRGSESTTQRRLIPTSTLQETASVTTGSWGQRLSNRALGMRRKAATIVLIALSCSLGLYALFGHDGLVAYQQKQHQAKQLQRQILSLQKENQSLALHDQRLQGDRDTIEYEAREQMHYTRPGEVIYTLPEIPKSAHK